MLQLGLGLVLMQLTSQNIRAFKKNQGFTLVEVLVAGLILFLTLGAGLRAYEVAMNGSYRAAQHLKMLQVTEFVQAHIHKAINDEVQDAEQTGRQINELAGQTNLMEVAINWQAVLFERGSPPRRYDENIGAEADFEPRFFKFQVTLRLTLNKRAQSFTYTELAWFKQLKVAQS